MKSFFRRLSWRIHTASRLTVLVFVVSLLLLAIAILSAWHVNSMQAQSEEIHSESVASIRAAVELEMHIQEVRHQLDRYLLLRPMNELSAPRSRLSPITSQRSSIERWLLQARVTAHTTEQLSYIQQVSEGITRFYSEIEKINEVPDSTDQAVAMVRSAEAILESEVLVPARGYLEIDERLLEESRTEAARQSHRLVWTLYCLGGFGSLVAMIAGYGMARMISRSLFELHIPMQDVAGKLREVAGDIVVSGELDLTDLGPVLQRVSAEVTSVVEQLHARHQEILHADQLAALGQLASGIAHEIRNPLMSMKMLVQSARGRDAAGLEELDLRILDDEIRRLEVLLNEFLDYARPKPLHKSLVDLRDLTESVVAFVQPQADIRQVSLDCTNPAQPVLASVDAPRIRQVLLNLLLNGIQVTPAGGTVALTLENFQSAGSQGCRIQIQDDGPGIRPEFANRIFEPFFSTQETGLGLGLAVSQRIVRSHGGEIYFESAVGGGATFVIQLPLEQPLSVGRADDHSRLLQHTMAGPKDAETACD